MLHFHQSALLMDATQTYSKRHQLYKQKGKVRDGLKMTVPALQAAYFTLTRTTRYCLAVSAMNSGRCFWSRSRRTFATKTPNTLLFVTRHILRICIRWDVFAVHHGRSVPRTCTQGAHAYSQHQQAHVRAVDGASVIRWKCCFSWLKLFHFSLPHVSMSTAFIVRGVCCHGGLV